MEGTLRDQIQDWWQGAIDGAESFDPDVLTDAAVTQFRQDREFCDRFLDEFLRQVVRQTGRKFLQDSRRKITRADPESTSLVVDHEAGVRALPLDRPMRHISSSDVAEIIERQRPIEPAKTWRDWFEIDQSTGNRVQLYYMTKSQVLAAARRRETDIQGNLKAIAFLYLIAGKMEDGQIVKDRWNDRQLHQLDDDIEVDRVRFSLKQLRQNAALKGSAA